MFNLRPISNRDRITAICAVGDAVGDFVYINGPLIGADYSVTKADVTQYTKVPSIGVIIHKLSATKCVVQMSGNVTGIYTGLTPGRSYWLGTNGQANILPPSPAILGKAYLQLVGVALDPNILKLELEKDMKVRIG